MHNDIITTRHTTIIIIDMSHTAILHYTYGLDWSAIVLFHDCWFSASSTIASACVAINLHWNIHVTSHLLLNVQLGQLNYIVSFSSTHFYIFMRAGGHYSLFIIYYSLFNIMAF